MVRIWFSQSLFRPHRFSDIIMLIVLGRASKCVAWAEIIEFGRQNLGRLRKMGMFRNGIPSEYPTMRLNMKC